MIERIAPKREKAARQFYMSAPRHGTDLQSSSDMPAPLRIATKMA